MELILIHKETNEYRYPLSRKQILIKVEFPIPGIYSINLVYWKRFRKATRKSKSLHSINPLGASSCYFTEISFADTLHYLQYVFQISTGEEKYYFSPEGVTNFVPEKFFEFEGALPDDVFKVPKRFKGNVGYHIFVERFFNGSKANDPSNIVKWSDKPTRDNFFGGDLIGIKKKIPYLKELGISVLFLTPIFEAKSNHKYDTCDYLKIDPSLGTIKDFRELVKLLHQSGIKLVLDGVFNHIGFYSSQFQDVIKNGRKSLFWNWFFINGDSVNSEKVNYECVGDYKWMPKLNTSNPSTQKYLIDVMLYWLKEGADGWRLDVGNELASSFRKKIRQKIKSIYPEDLLLSETWQDGEDLLRGDEVDSIMNYRLREAIMDYLVLKSISKDAFVKKIEAIYFDYPEATHDVLYNLLDSHDTERFLTSAKSDKRILKTAAAFQFLLPGLPVIYYGDEIGMEGGNDPLCRAGMKWDSIDNNLLSFYKKLIYLKNTYESLRIGKIVFISTPKNINVCVFARYTAKEKILVAINAGNQKEKVCLSSSQTQIIGVYKTILFDITPYGYEVKDMSTNTG